MAIMFSSILRDAGFPLTDVLLVRHQERSERGRTPYDLWVRKIQSGEAGFDDYHAYQKTEWRKKFSRPYWATFVGTPDNRTLFVGVYRCRFIGVLDHDMPFPHRDEIRKAGSCDAYEAMLDDRLGDLIGKLFVSWGSGFRAWVQNGENQDKAITELRSEITEPPFPGFLEFFRPLSQIEQLPSGWVEALRASRGVYLLTCPKTKEQYVGSATGADGFWGRWQDYLRNSHGGNIGLRSRDPSDYQISVLEVSGSASTAEDIIQAEQRWKSKLQSREMGLNRN